MNTSTFVSGISIYQPTTQKFQRMTLDDAFAKYGRTPTCMHVCEIDLAHNIQAAKDKVESSKCTIS